MDPIAPFALRLPERVRFGRGALAAATPEIAAFGSSLVLVHGRDPARAEPLRAALAAQGLALHTVTCDGEPTLDMLTEALAAARPHAPQAVVAIGGGAVLDLGKALAALLLAETDPLAHLEVVGQGLPLAAPPLPCIAIPTTAGTGSEATKNAVIGSPRHGRKVSLRDDRMVPALAVIDPALTDGTPLPQTLASGLDAVTQVIEPYLSARATPFTDALARPTIRSGLEALATLDAHGEDAGARDRLAYTAHVSGIALANAGLGAVHGLAGVLGGRTGVGHGAVCARLLGPTLRALEDAAPAGSETARRVTEVIAEIDRALPCGIDGLSGWLTARGVAALPPLSKGERAEIAADAGAASSMKASPVAFREVTLAAILSRAAAA